MPKPKPLNGEWIIERDSLLFRARDGRVVIPSAEQIYRMVFEDESGTFVPPLRKEHSPIDIDFSPYPAPVEIQLTAERAQERTDLKASIAIAVKEGVGLIESTGARPADHIVIKKKWYPVSREALLEAKRILQGIGAEGPGRITLLQYLDLRKLASSNLLIRDLTEDVAQLHGLHHYDVSSAPEGLVGNLYPYQSKGWQWLNYLREQNLGGVLADEMGLGKTVQIIALVANEARKSSKKIALVVATGTLLENWRREFARFAPGIVVKVHHGATRTGFPRELGSADVVITSYDVVTRDIALLRQIDWGIVVLDEAQAIKNAETKRSQAVRRLPRMVAYCVTGTPLENRLSDLWSLVDFVLPGFLGTRSQFDKSFPSNQAGAEALEPLISPILLRRRVSEVAQDLPLRIDIPQALVLDDANASEYDRIREETLRDYGVSGGLVALMKLRMYCCHPALVTGADFENPAASSPKYARLLEILEEIAEREEKALVFTSFNEMNDLLVRDIPLRIPVACTSIDGRLPIADRQRAVDDFAQNAGPAVLVLNPRAAGTGLNITAANHVIHYNLEWNPAVEDQASARAYRRGQTLPVTVHRLYYVSTVEEVMDDRLALKRELAQTAVVGTDGLSRDDADILRALRKSPSQREANAGH